VRILLCDDDAHLRTVLRGIVQERGHEVIAEADSEVDTKALVATAKPDAVILDIALRQGTGSEAGRMAASYGCRVIIFSAFLDSISDTSFADAVVAKPDFNALEAAIDALTLRTTSGDRWVRGQPDRRASGDVKDRPMPVAAVEEADAFYRALGVAQTGDSLMLIDVPTGAADAEAFAVVARGVIRPQDHLMLRGTQVALLLQAGSSDAAIAVASRLMKATEAAPCGREWRWRHHVIADDESPAEVYQNLRQQI
jgi:DNA-binding response OmpR family regulator